MGLNETDIARRAFATSEWSAAAEAIVSATGLSADVVDFPSGEVLSGGRPCPFCPLLGATDQCGPESCFDEPPASNATSGRMVCRAGLPVLHAPVAVAGRPVAQVAMRGFVTSTRERRGRYENLLSRGFASDAARRRVKLLPVIARAQVEGFVQLACASAATAFASMRDNMATTERIEELKLFLSAGQHVVSASHLDEDMLAGVVAEATMLAGAQAGALLGMRGRSLEVIARTDGWRAALGTRVPGDSTVAGSALSRGQAVVSAVRDEYVAFALPLLLAERPVGVFEFRLAADAAPLKGERLARLVRFAQFVAIALERESERAAVQRAMGGYTQLNSLASSLGGQTDDDEVSRRVLREIETAFDFRAAGVVLSGWGVDRADVSVAGTLARDDVDQLLALVTGREASALIADVRVLSGTVDEEADGRGCDWALSAVEIGHGEIDVGWLFVARNDGGCYTAQDRALLEGFAAHCGPAFGRAALFARVRDDYAATIEALSDALGRRERGRVATAGNVMEYAVAIGERLGLGVEEVERLRFAGILHDTGKAGIPGEITLTPPSPTPGELLSAHSRTDVRPTIIEQIEFLDSLTPIVMHHHENWDGSGYPHGLRAEEIPRLARVLRVADAFDALVTGREGAKRLSPAKACDRLAAGAGTVFDPEAVAALAAEIEVRANAGRTGLLADTGEDDRPVLYA